MTNKNSPAFITPFNRIEADTTRGPHPCEICRRHIDPATKPEPFTPLDLMPFCELGLHDYMLRRVHWHCYSFEREPGDQ